MSSHIYEEVTSAIVAELEAGVAPWVKPWKSGACGYCMPVNAATNRAYRGVNILALWSTTVRGGYPTHRFVTFRQAQALGGSIRKGEKATPIVFLKSATKAGADEETEEEPRGREVRFLRYYWVFNVSQAEGLPDHVYVPSPVESFVDRFEKPASFLKALGARIVFGGDRACYIPSQDTIALPGPKAFEGPEHFFATSLHEHSHWAGHESRLNRDLSGRFGSQAYAAEELIAELSAAFLCAELGVTGRLRHAEYISSWLTLLRNDHKAVFTAASRASQSADYLQFVSKTPAHPT